MKFSNMLGPLLALQNGFYWRLTIQKVIDIHAIDYNLAPTVFTKVREDEVALSSCQLPVIHSPSLNLFIVYDHPYKMNFNNGLTWI